MDTGPFHDTESLGIKTGPDSSNQYTIREYSVLSWKPIAMAVGRPVLYNRLATRSTCSAAHDGEIKDKATLYLFRSVV
jgi:hypothetical protein